jgi:hypothetical protein
MQLDHLRLCAPAAPARYCVPVASGQLARTLHCCSGECIVLPKRQLHPEWLAQLVAIHLWDVTLEAILEHHVRFVVVVVVRLLELANLRQGGQTIRMEKTNASGNSRVGRVYSGTGLTAGLAAHLGVTLAHPEPRCLIRDGQRDFVVDESVSAETCGGRRRVLLRYSCAASTLSFSARAVETIHLWNFRCRSSSWISNSRSHLPRPSSENLPPASKSSRQPLTVPGSMPK